MATSGYANRQQQLQVASWRPPHEHVAALSLSFSRKAPLLHSVTSSAPFHATPSSRAVDSDVAFSANDGICTGESQTHFQVSVRAPSSFRPASRHAAILAATAAAAGSSTTPSSLNDIPAASERGVGVVEGGGSRPCVGLSPGISAVVRLASKHHNKTDSSRRQKKQQCRQQQAWSSTAPIAAVVGRLNLAGVGGEGGAVPPSIADLMTAVLRRNSAVPPLACSSLSALGGNHSPSLEPTNGGGGGGGGGGGDDGTGMCGANRRQKRVLILMSDTGGGHRASAEALKSVFELEYGDMYKVFVIDLWKDHTPWPFNQLPKSYSFLVKNEYLWKFAFHASAPRLVHEFNFTTTGTFIAREMAKAFTKYQPDVIVSVHPLMQHVPLRILRSRGLLGRIPFTTVITDLNSCHPTWFHKHVTLCFAPNQEVSDRALKAGLNPSQIRVHGLPIRPDFAMAVKPKNILRQELGMDLDLKAVLLVGGGEGMGPVEATARALAQELAALEENGRPRGQLIIVCGRNRSLATSLESVHWPIPVQVKGFVTNMSDWMGACDCIITKAGPGTIAESLIRGLPMILNDFIAGQEAGNIPFVVDNGAGKFIKDPREIGKTVREWFGPRIDEFKSMAQNCLKMARPKAVFEIVRDIHLLAQQRTYVEQPQFAVA
ncbi:hypothetical protein CBR_g29284 [Chara braunii]|uniref:monogalactosyldiacylglycerol synthase n=1 Tax=Chara braunii TaxID=69332 RepID=A0A388LAL3_CHABU|nr:hypothetical protein CBR_g29284 [Chara braunii]|eukprot:GBG79232.1 hypothetical protein CBR_g29284 [Chara braunii]